MKRDAINPSHYVKRGMEVRKVIRAWELTYHCGDAVSYILRAKFKDNYAEDLKKAIQHLQFELEEESADRRETSKLSPRKRRFKAVKY